MASSKMLSFARPYFNLQPTAKVKQKKMADCIQTMLMPIPPRRREPRMTFRGLMTRDFHLAMLFSFAQKYPGLTKYFNRVLTETCPTPTGYILICDR